MTGCVVGGGFILIVTLLIGWLADKLWGDPPSLPHPIVLFGKTISWFESHLNRGEHRRFKGILTTTTLVCVTYFLLFFILKMLGEKCQGSAGISLEVLDMAVCACLIFFGLSGTTLCREVSDVFAAVDISVEKGRMQVSRIVGRDTSKLNAQEIRTAALETLSENLSDGVIAPLFWLAIGGIPAMYAYKMVNTLDSMIGYRTERFKMFGFAAARLDDVANYVPARLTALLMILVSCRFDLFGFVRREGKHHASPNSGYPEAALAGILNCRFGGTHTYFGEVCYKPYIGTTERQIGHADMCKAISVNQKTELIAVGIICLLCLV